jgi:hypothetical protein
LENEEEEEEELDVREGAFESSEEGEEEAANAKPFVTASSGERLN